jgi:hypothetical protein
MRDERRQGFGQHLCSMVNQTELSRQPRQLGGKYGEPLSDDQFLHDAA